MQFDTGNNTPTTREDNFDASFSGWYYADGIWTRELGQALINGYGKRSMGIGAWTDYTVQVDVTYTNAMNGGLLLRARNLSLGSNGTSAQLGTDFLQGYFITISNNAVILGKHNYNWTQLTSSPGSYTLDRKYTLKATISGDNIKVYVDNMDIPVIDYTDPDPFLNGRPGLRVHNAKVYFDNFIVTVLDPNDPSKLETPYAEKDIDIYPNPTNGLLMINNIAGFSELSVFKADGQQIYSLKLNDKENNHVLNVSDYESGLYLLKLTGNNYSAVKKFIKK